MRAPAELVATFRERGLKVTPQRQLLFRLLHGNDQHPTADVLFAEASAAMPGISLRTVYQTLTDLTAMGELRSVDVDGGATRFDPNVDDHHHAVCNECHRIIDVYVPAGQLVPSDLDGFAADSAAVVYRGRCQRCSDDADRAGRLEAGDEPACRNNDRRDPPA